MILFRVLLVSFMTFTLTFFGHDSSADMQTKAPFKHDERFLQLPTGSNLWVETDINDPSQPVQLILNGLTNSTKSFGKLTDEFKNRGLNVVRFDFNGQAKTLLASHSTDNEYTVEKQVADVVALVTWMRHDLGLKGPIDVLGQSYGGGILLGMLGLEPAFSEKNFRSVTAFAPYTEPLRDQDKKIRDEVNLYANLIPNFEKYEETLYDAIHWRTVMSTYWIFEPEVLTFDPISNYHLLDGVFHLARGIRKFDATQIIANMPNIPINIVMSNWDQYIPADVIPKFWSSLPPNKRGLFLRASRVEHKMLQVAPALTANIMDITSHQSDRFKFGSEIDVSYGSEVITDRLTGVTSEFLPLNNKAATAVTQLTTCEALF